MTTIDRREILSRVAAGTMSPHDAAAHLDSIGEDERAADNPITKVRIVRHFGSLEIVGDSSVHQAVAEGPHRARIDGDVMVLEAETGNDGGGFGFLFAFGHDWSRQTLRVRMNPSLALDLQVQAGNCRVRGVEGPIRAEIQAGSATIDGFKGPIELSVQASSLKASGRLDGGDSRVSCDAGSVNLNLERGSSVRIKARASMGKVELPGQLFVTSGNGSREVKVGDGAGSLLLETHMGSVKVSEDW